MLKWLYGAAKAAFRNYIFDFPQFYALPVLLITNSKSWFTASSRQLRGDKFIDTWCESKQMLPPYSPFCFLFQTRFPMSLYVFALFVRKINHPARMNVLRFFLIWFNPLHLSNSSHSRSNIFVDSDLHWLSARCSFFAKCRYFFSL